MDCDLLDGPVVSMATGSTFSALLTQHGSVFYCGQIGGLEKERQEEGEEKEEVEEKEEEEEQEREEEGETDRESVEGERREGEVKLDGGKGGEVWRPLVVAGDGRESGRVAEIKAGLHYLAALEIDKGLPLKLL